MSLSYAVTLELVDKMTAPVRSLSAGFDHLKGKIESIQHSAGGFDRIHAALSRTGQAIGSVVAAAGKVSAVAGIGMGGIAASATNISAKYEDLGAVLETLEGSSAKAQTSLGWIKKFTAETPYELENTATAFARLKAYGIDPMDGTMRTLGDTSAAMGKDIMDGVEMIADAVVGENERLKEFGIRGSKAGDEITYNYKNRAGQQQTKTVNKNDQDEIRKALMDIFNEKYAGAMDKRSKTFNGILSNVHDTVAGLQAAFMSGGTFEGLKEALQSRLDFLTKLLESGRVEQWGATFSNGVNVALEALGRVSNGISSANQRLSGFVGGWRNLGQALGIIKSSAISVTGLMQGNNKMPEWLKPSRGNTNTQMSPLLDQLRTIEKGDTLWNIAKQTDGIGSKYTEIAALNSEIIKDADKIFPGQQIRIPKLSGLPEWAKARKISGEMSPAQQSAPATAPASQNIVAIAELAKTNKVIAAAILLRKTWDAAFAGITASFERAKSFLSSGFNSLANYAIANSGKITAAWQQVTAKIEQLRQTVASNFAAMSGFVSRHGGQIRSVLMSVAATAMTGLLQWPLRVAAGVRWLSGIWSQSVGAMQAYLPRLQAAAGTAFSGIRQWLQTNAAAFQQVLSGVAVAAVAQLTVWFEALATMARNGSLTAWLDDVAAAIPAVVSAVTEFASGLWSAIKSVSSFTIGFVEFIGGWKVLAGIFAGGYLIAMLSGFLQGLGALVGLIGALLTPLGAIVVLFAAVAIGLRYLILYWDQMSVGGRVLGVVLVGIGTAILGYVAYLKMAAMWTAFQLTPLGAWIAGLSLASVWAGITAAATWVMTAATSAFTAVLAVLTSPITLVIAGIAALSAGAYYLYTNWGQVKAYLSETTWGQMLLSAINMILSPVQTFNSAVAYLQGMWASTKASLAETTWGQMILTVINMLFAPFEMFKAALAALTGGWSAAKASLGDSSWGQAIMGTINAVMGGFEKLKAGFAAVKNTVSEKISAGVNYVKSAVGMETSGARAFGGGIDAGKQYRVNEYGDELIQRGNKTFLMAGTAGQVVPINKMQRETPYAAPSGFQTVPQKAAMAQQSTSRSEVDVRIISDKPVRVERMRSDADTTLNVNTGRMMESL